MMLEGEDLSQHDVATGTPFYLLLCFCSPNRFSPSGGQPTFLLIGLFFAPQLD